MVVRRDSIYRRLLRNRTFLFLWGGQTISDLGDAVFNVAVMWVVYVRTGSALQTGIVPIITNFSAVLLGPIGGVYADRWNRTWTMLVAAMLSAVIVGAAAVPIALGHFSPLLIYGTVLLLNTAALFSSPARTSVMPEVVGRDLLATAGGLFSMLSQGASLIGTGIAGIIIAVFGTTWALVVDAVSFAVGALAVIIAHIPGRTSAGVSRSRPSLVRELAEGWRVVRAEPVVRSFVWVAALINVASFMGPLFPALVRVQLHGDVKSYGFLEASAVVGGMAGGLAAGALERRLGAGRLLVMGFAIAGCCFAALGISTSLLLSAALFTLAPFWLIASDVSMGALTPALIPEAFRGRASGIMRATAVISMPLTILAGGWLADRIGPGPLYVAGGLWAVAVAVLAWSNPHLRSVRIESVRR